MPKAQNAYAIAFAALLALTAFYATYKLTESPRTWYDEGIYIQVAKSFEHTGTQSIQVAPGEYKRIDFLTIGYPVIAPVSIGMALFGDSILGARIPMVMFILLFAAASAYLVYAIVGPRQALMSLALIATFPLMYGNGKNVLGEIPGLFYCSLALIAFYKLEKDKFAGAWNYVFLGLTVGLTAAAKPVFLLLPVGIFLTLIINFRSIPLKWKEILIGALSFVIPMMLWIFFQFGPEASPSAILNYYANPYGIESVPTTAVENFLRFFTESTPMYAGLLMGAWLISICVRMYRREKITLTEQSAFVFSVLVMLAYLRTAGWYRYFFQAMTLALVFAPLSFSTFFSAIFTKKHAKYAMGAAVLLVAVLTCIQLYQLNFSSWVAEHYKGTTAQKLTEYFSSYPKERSIFVYNSPAAVIFLPSDNYYQYLQPTAAIGYGNHNLELLKQGAPDDVLLAPAQYEENPALFEHYSQSGTAAAYLILSRK